MEFNEATCLKPFLDKKKDLWQIINRRRDNKDWLMALKQQELLQNMESLESSVDLFILSNLFQNNLGWQFGMV